MSSYIATIENIGDTNTISCAKSRMKFLWFYAIPVHTLRTNSLLHNSRNKRLYTWTLLFVGMHLFDFHSLGQICPVFPVYPSRYTYVCKRLNISTPFQGPLYSSSYPFSYVKRCTKVGCILVFVLTHPHCQPKFLPLY